MSEKISLKKRQDQLKLNLKKVAIDVETNKPVLRVGCALDISGSMGSLYRNGVVSDFVGKLLPFGILFDDNQQIDMWAFNHSYQELPPATEAVYDNYVGKAMRGISISGGTSYAPVMEAIYEEYFGGQKMKTVSRQIEVTEEVPAKGFLAKLTGKKETRVITKTIYEQVPDSAGAVDTTPAMILFQTDGENTDTYAVRNLLRSHVNTPVYWFMVGVGNDSSFSFLKEIADEFPNVDFISVSDMALTDSELYDKLLSREFGDWVKKFGATK